MKTFLLGAVCSLLVGCDTVNFAQYRIASTASSAADRAQVIDILRSVATQTKLSDETGTSRAPDTLVLYTQPNVQHFRVELAARAVANDLIVDLNAGFGPQPREFRLACRLLTPALHQAFGERVTEQGHAHYIP